VAAALALGLSGALLARMFLFPGSPPAQAHSVPHASTPPALTLTVSEDEAPEKAPAPAVAQAGTAETPSPAPATQPAAIAVKPHLAEPQPGESTNDIPGVAAADDAHDRAEAAAQARRLRVRSVVLIGDQRYCVINGRRFEEGESVDGFRVDRITASRVIVAKGKFRFELRPQADMDSRVLRRTNVDNGTRVDNRPEPPSQQQPPRPSNGGPTVYGSGPGGGPPGSPPPPPPPPPPGGRQPRR
jgi:hypothetical protein